MNELEHKVLDHGSVRLVTGTSEMWPYHAGGISTLPGAVNWDLLIVRAARTSYDCAWRTGEDEGADEKLIYRLLRKRHTSPFECVSATFEVVAPIFVYREWHRHRTQSFNEQSARYRELPEMFFVPDATLIGAQGQTEKQAREIADNIDPDLWKARLEECDMLHDANKGAFTTYRYLLDA